MLKQFIPAIKYGNGLSPDEMDSTGASSGQAPIFNGTTVAWATPAVAPGAITLVDGHILVGNASDDATDVALSGDATISNLGALTIANSAITNVKVSASAAIAFSKLATLADANILVGSALGVPTSVALSGDATISNAGAISVIDLTITGQTTGDILYFNGTNWVKLAIGTAGQVLTVNAGATAPEWQTP